MTGDITDEALMLDSQRGSREAFEELFARYREPPYGIFRFFPARFVWRKWRSARPA